MKSSGGANLQDTTFTAVYDAANRMTAITLQPGTPSERTYSLTYDEHGNLAQKQNAAVPGEVTTYTWDARNRLTEIAMTDGGQTSTAAFRYDALGRRIERLIEQGASVQRSQYVYDGIQAIGELVDGRLAATILTGLNIDEVIARTVNLAGGANPVATKSYLTDALGSVLAMTLANQSPETFYSYSPYGETSQLGADPDNPASSNQYTARENDGLVGGTGGGALYYYRARYYDPVLKRFVAEDPIGVGAGLNFFRYVGNNPIGYRDPSGLLTITGGGTLRIPGWLKYVIPGFIGQGGGGGIAIQLTKNGRWCPDFGVYWTGSAGGGDIGIGKATLNLGLQAGGITNLAGRGFDVSGQWGMWGGTANFDWQGDFQGAQINWGPGYNVGIAGSMTGSWSIRSGLSTPESPGPETCDCEQQ